MQRNTTLLLTFIAMAFALTACKPDAKKAPKTKTDTKVTKKTNTKAKTNKKADTKAKTDTKAAVKTDTKAGEKGGTVKADAKGGKWVTSKLYPVKFRVPDDWKVVIEDDGISATDEDESTTVVLVGSESTGMIQNAINDLKKKVKFKDAKFDKSNQVVLNGLPGQNIFGTAVLSKAAKDGKPIDEEIQFIAYNLKVGKKAVTMMIFSEATMYEAKKETILGLANTLTKS